MKNLFPYILVFCVILVFLYNHFLYNPKFEPTVITTELNELQKQSFTTLIEMTKLLISLSTALFGLIGYFSLENFKTNNGNIGKEYRIDLILAFSFAAISIDFGYIFMAKWVEELSMGVFSPYNKLVASPQFWQLVSFLFAFFFAGRLIYRSLFK